MMPASSDVVDRSGSGESRFWRLVLVGFLRGAPAPLMRFVRRHVTSAPLEEVVILGRRTGRARRLMLSLYDIGGRWYVGHPNGSAQWVRNLEAAGRATVILRDGSMTEVAATMLPPGPERDAVLDASGRQPAPAGLVYRLARRHVNAVGHFFRLVPIPADPVAPVSSGASPA